MNHERVQYSAQSHTTGGRDEGASRDWRRFLATSVALAAFGLVLVSSPSFAQSVISKKNTPRDTNERSASMTGLAVVQMDTAQHH